MAHVNVTDPYPPGAAAKPTPRPAPPLLTSEWLNSNKPLDIPDFRGRILVIEAFQMLCPGCVSHGLPQAQRISR